MWRDWLLRAAQLIGSIVGAVVLASLLATLSHPAHGLWPFLTALCERIFAAVRGDFGLSSVTGVPAMASAIDMMSFTFQLLAGGAVIALLIGIPLGILLSASRALRAAAPLIQIIAATPVFVAALALIWIAVRVLHWSGISQASALSWVDLVRSDGWSAALQAFALPALTVGAAGAASVQLSICRAAAVAWSAPYRSGLRMMGLGALDIDLHYALPEVLAALLRDLGADQLDVGEFELAIARLQVPELA